MLSKTNLEILVKIIYAVETGGQVYGNCRYDDFTEAYANSSNETAITIGAGQWFAGEAKTLLQKIKEKDPDTFKKLDSKGEIAADLKSADWSKYQLRLRLLLRSSPQPPGKRYRTALLENRWRNMSLRLRSWE